MSVKKRDAFITTVLIVLIVLGIFFYGQVAESVLNSIVGEDGYTKIADSETVITGSWDCPGTLIRGGMFDSNYYCDSTYYRVLSYVEGGSESSNAAAGTTGSDTTIKISATGGSHTIRQHVVVKQDLRNKYFKVTVKQDNTCDSRFGTCGASINVIDDYTNPTQSQSLGDIDSEGALSVEFIPSVLEEGLVAVLVNGEKTLELDVTDWNNLYFEFSTVATSGVTSSWQIVNPRYQYLFSCEKADDEILGAITYSGGQTISLSAEAKLPDIEQQLVKFCTTHGAILTDASEGGSTETMEYYYALAQGEAVETQDDQTLTLFAIFDATGLPTSCGDDAYNFNTGECESVSGIVTFLREGTLDTETGTYIVEPTTVCEINDVPSGVYYLDEDECVIYLTADIRCIDAESGYEFSAADDGCVKYVESTEECEDADATVEITEDGRLKCVIPAEEALEVVTTDELTDAECQEEYGETATVMTNSAGEATGCVITKVSSIYYCKGVQIDEDDTCESDNPGDVTGIEISTVDASEAGKPSYALLYTVLVVTAIVIAFAIILIMMKKRR